MSKKSFTDYIPFWPSKERTPIVAVLRLSGPIGMPMAFGRSLSMAGLAEPIEQAFSVKRLKAVALVINSPGGSPVQSTLIFKRIRALAQEKNVPVFAFAEDAAASGGYMLALAGDEIYADASSIVGSIGVISAGFGFTELIARYGIERRVYTSGKSKSSLDAFKPEKPEDVARLKELQQDIHEEFIGLVKDRRGDSLKGAEDTLFTGEFWTGKKAEELGLIDGIGDMRSVMRSRFGEKVKLKLVGTGGPWWRKKTGFSEHLSGGLPAALASVLLRGQAPGRWSDDVLASLEQRSLWSRLGL